jgi:hypothetical protein
MKAQAYQADKVQVILDGKTAILQQKSLVQVIYEDGKKKSYLTIIIQVEDLPKPEPRSGAM